MSEPALFDGYEPAPPAPPLSPDRRRTQRQADQIAIGVHPLTGGRLHPLASRHRDARSPRTDPFTCGSCWHRELVNGDHAGRYPKCLFGVTNPTDKQKAQFPRVTSGPATDVRAWWPACPDYSPSDAISSDAARWVPTPSVPTTQEKA